jgi:hypothetical protein
MSFSFISVPCPQTAIGVNQRKRQILIGDSSQLLRLELLKFPHAQDTPAITLNDNFHGPIPFARELSPK